MIGEFVGGVGGNVLNLKGPIGPMGPIGHVVQIIVPYVGLRVGTGAKTKDGLNPMGLLRIAGDATIESSGSLACAA